MERCKVIRLQSVQNLHMLTTYEVCDITGLNYEAALAFMKVHGEQIGNRYYIAEAKLKKVLEG